MTTRKIKSYLLMPHSVNGGLRYSAKTQKNWVRTPRPGLLYRMKDFLTNNIIAWFVHNWHIRKRADYPAPGASIHPLVNSAGGAYPVNICIAADWATATPQADYIGKKIAQLSPDYTIHLGDTYYSGAEDELVDNFGKGGPSDPDGLWPRGSCGSFALLGNHEMFSSGGCFLNMIADPARRFGVAPGPNQFAGQPAPFFCLLSERWTILALDTGYDSLQTRWYKRFFSLHPNNVDLVIPDQQLEWLRANPHIFRPDKGIVLLAHHQYITAFGDESEFPGPAAQMKEFLGNREVLWLWGHEHRFSMYNRYASPDGKHITAYGRCIGNGSMVDEHLEIRKLDPAKALSRGLELYDFRVADTFHFDDKPLGIGYNGFAQLTVRADSLEITYWGAYSNGHDRRKEPSPLITESWEVNAASGSVVRQSIVDHTKDPVTGKSDLSYPPFSK
jgi:hypothetical protein